MLRIFSQIRRSLLEKGIARQYVVYALGEILLVMIGILLALQVNNWNEDRINRQIETEYLRGLKEEFTTNLTELEDNMRVCEKTIGAAVRFLSFTGPDKPQIGEDQMSFMIDSLLRRSVEYEPSPGVLEDLIGSGNLNILSSTPLRKELSNWKAKLERVYRQEQTVLEYRRNIKDLFIEKTSLRYVMATISDIDAGRFDNTNTEVLMDKRFENNLAFFITSSSSLNSEYYTELKKVNENLLSIINTQLKH